MNLGADLTVIILAFVRIASFIFFLPFLSGKTIPNMAKVIISVGLALAVADKYTIPEFSSTFHFIGFVIMQIVIGLSLAKIVELMLSIPKIAGSIMDMEMGFSGAQIIDPNSKQMTTILGVLMNTFYTLIFISLDGIQHLIMPLIRSFELVETLAFLTEKQFLDYFLVVFMYMMTSAIQIALPVMGSMFIVNVVLAILGRTADKLRVFDIMFAVKITLGILFLMVSTPILGEFFNHLITQLIDEYTNSFSYLFKK